MNPVIRNILALIAGIILGGALNMGIIMVSGSIIPPPAGADLTSMEGLKASMHLMEPKHFLMPWLAHALGTLLGALVASLIGVNRKTALAIGVSVWFMIGGIANIIMLPSPLWFTIVDLALAYLPMGLLGNSIAAKLTKK